ncbi:MAG: DUF262 domain-containing protein [Verrucomicrobiia bacterium]|jgi:hypothetical protein
MSTSAKHLPAEIESKAKEIHTDAYPMSIGELLSIYKEGELDIHPEFQRFFRWSSLQKSKFIESILLGIPIPSIFVSQRDDGIWDVVDGVQRLSTIFEFLGVLKNEDGKTVTPSRLVGTEYLPSLEGIAWEDEDSPEHAFPNSLQIDFKRQKLDLKIIKKESDENTKYDLFERLNTLGSQLSDQEVRNCLLVMINREFFQWLERRTSSNDFQSCIALTDRAMQERYDMELVLRFLVFSRAKARDLQGIKDVGAYLTTNMRAIATAKKFDMKAAKEVFDKTFTGLYKVLGSDCFARQDSGRGRGGFLISVFEVIAIGLGSYLWADPSLDVDSSKIKHVHKHLWDNADFKQYSKSGVSASSRIPRLIPLGRKLFAE